MSDDFEMDKTQAPQRNHVAPSPFDFGKTMAPRRERKTEDRFEPGDLVMNRYKVLAELGQGGMGVVYKCFDETAGIEVALKALPPELSHNTLEMEDIKENFQLVHKLHHPNIAAYSTLERDSCSNYYLIMECVDGDDLRRWIRRKHRDGSMTWDEFLSVIRQVAAALDYAHEQKIMHRDIKPGNIMIMADGTVKVLDFGLAAQIHTSMTRVSMAYRGTSGTGPYMAPEQWRGRPQGAAADQYALAVMAYEMLSGSLPFENADPAVLREAVLNETPDEIGDLPDYTQTAIRRAMSKDPDERYPNCTAFAMALAGEEVPELPKSNTGKQVSKSRNPLLVRARLFLENEDFETAISYCERVLDQEPENGEAYFVRLLAELKLQGPEALVPMEDIANNRTFKLAVRFADPNLADLLNGVLEEQKRIREEARLAEERRIAEEKRRAEEARLAEERRIAEEKRRMRETIEAKTSEAEQKFAGENSNRFRQYFKDTPTALWIMYVFIIFWVIVLVYLYSCASVTINAEVIEEAKRIVKEESKKAIKIADGVSLTMIGIEPGTFMMGSENVGSNERPVHRVTLTKPYYLGETEVTQAQWRAVMGNNPSHFQGNNRPVEMVSWHEAVAFCQKLNDQGKAPKGWKFTLPTEAQWEFAARGRNLSKSYKYSGSNDINEVAWCYDNSGNQTHDVREKKPNELGLYDMSGNVWEWCLDWYGDYSSSAVTDPQGPQRDSSRCIGRGGSWNLSAPYCQVARRRGNYPDRRDFSCGFRLALVPVQ